MLISDKQQEANRQNALHSTGPKTPEGKAAIRLNALQYGLRARVLLIPGENPEEYKRLWADLEAEWQPQGRSERLQLEQMATAQWLLARVACGEAEIYQREMDAAKQFALLNSASTQRARLERSYTNGRRELEHLQQKRQARQQQPQAAPTVKAVQTVHPPAEPRVPHSGYLMSDDTEDHPVFCSPAIPDSR